MINRGFSSIKSIPFWPWAAAAAVSGQVYYLCRYLFGAAGFPLIYAACGAGILALLWLSRSIYPPKPGAFQAAVPEGFAIGRRIFHTGLFLAVVFVLKQADFSWKDFERTGWFIPAHLACRVIFLVYFIAACFGAGKALVSKKISPVFGGNPQDFFILCFFTGASMLALLSVAAGLVGGLNLFFGLLVLTPLVFYAAPEIHKPLSLLFRKTRELWRGEFFLFSSHFMFGWLLAGTVLFFLISQALYPGIMDHDVWVHYLHYYRKVIETGSLGPHALWNHFYVSKGAGLFFLTGVLSDPFSAQLVSAGFVLSAAVILYRLCRVKIRESVPAAAAVLIFLCFYNACPLKHHAVMTAYLAFFVWIIAKILANPGREESTLYFICALPAIFYFGFYQPLILFLPVGTLVCVAAWVYFSQGLKKQALPLLLLAAAGLLGAVTALAVNFAMTGLLYDAPPAFFWRFADAARFLKTVGPSGIAYFMERNSDTLANVRFLDAKWLRLLFRIDVFTALFPAPILITGFFLACRGGLNMGERRDSVLISFIFLICALLFSLPFKVESFQRLYVFAVFFNSFFAVLILNAVLTALPDFFRKGVSVLLLTLLSVCAFSQSVSAISASRLDAISNYTLGRFSFADVLQETDSAGAFNITLPDIIGLRKMIGRDPVIFITGFDPGPGYFYPGPGLISEPSYTLGPDAEEIVFGPADEARARLQALGVDYLLINSLDSVFTSLVFSELFSNENLNKYFYVAFQKGESYLLGWRQSPLQADLPETLMQALDLKRSSALVYPYSGRLQNDLGPKVAHFFQRGDNSQSMENLAVDVKELVTRNMVDKAQVEGNKALASQFTGFLSPRLDHDLPNFIHSVNTKYRGPEEGRQEASVNAITYYIQLNEINFYKNFLGRPFMNAVFRQETTFQEIYRSREKFRKYFLKPQPNKNAALKPKSAEAIFTDSGS